MRDKKRKNTETRASKNRKKKLVQKGAQIISKIKCRIQQKNKIQQEDKENNNSDQKQREEV